MIEVNLHPDRGRKKGSSGRGFPIAIPAALKRIGGGGGSGGERDVWTMVAIGVPVLVLLVIGWLWLSQRSVRGDLEARLESAVQDSTRLVDLRMLSDSLTARRRRISERLDLVRTLDEGRFVWPHLLDEISRALPPYTWLTSIRQNATEPRLEVQLGGLSANPLAITRFVRNLQDSPYVAEVRILGSQQELIDNVAAQAFILMVAYEAPPPETVETVPLVEGI